VARLQREIEDRMAAVATMELVLEGEGGGRWYLNLRDGETRVAETPDSPPLVRVSQRRDDWEALARAQLGAERGALPGGDLSRSRVEKLRGLRGTLEFRLATDEGERSLVVRFGEAEEPTPRCTLRLRADDARRLQSAELTPQAAFLQGLVKLEGDIAFAMQVGAVLFM
jgi:putative sterol carrier protein